jgi:hypothetical protein
MAHMGCGKRVLAGAAIAVSLAGCTSGLGGGFSGKPAAVEPTFKLDGLYKFVEDGTGSRNGAPVTDLYKGETQWAFRTSCNENGCVAAGGKFDPEHPTAPPSPVWAADYVDGKWTQVSLTESAECPRNATETYKSDQWSIWDISQTADKNLALKITVAATDDCNFVNEYTPAMTRIGDLPKDFPLSDPAQAPKRVPSYPANSFRGKYTVDYRPEGTGQSQDSEHMDVKTTCLRAQERCVATTINVDPRDPGTPYSLQVYEFNGDKFSFQQTIGKTQCQDGREGIGTKAVSLPLPPAPVPDPLQSLTGRLALAVSGDCTASQLYDATFTRTGD